MVQVVSSVVDNFGYYYNLGYLRSALERNGVQLIKVDVHAPPAFQFDKANVYNFIRSAKPTIRETMTTYLEMPDVLPGLQTEDREIIQEPFECLFNNRLGYKKSLNEGHQRRVESMHMLISLQ